MKLAFHLVILASALVLVPSGRGKQPDEKFVKLITPSVVAQGETFTGMIVEETPKGFVPLSAGTQFKLGTVAMSVGPQGVVEFPPYQEELGNRFLDGFIEYGGATIAVSSHVEIVRVPKDAPCKLAESSKIASAQGNFRVRGQGLDKIKSPCLKSPGFKDIPLDRSVGSSLERIYPPPAGMQPGIGQWHFSAEDPSGKTLECPTKTTVPRVRVDGSEITQRGQRGEFTLNTNVDTGVILIGGEDKIALDRRTAFTTKSNPAKIGFTALGLGLYEMTAKPISEEDVAPAKDSPKVDCKTGKPTCTYDPAKNTTEVVTPVEVVQQGGTGCPDAPVEGVVTHPGGVDYGSTTCNGSGKGNVTVTVPGNVTVARVAFHPYRVPGHEWIREKQEPPYLIDDGGLINDEPLHHCQGHRLAIVFGKASNADIAGAAAWTLSQRNVQHKVWFVVKEGIDPAWMRAKTASATSGTWSEAEPRNADIAATFNDCCYWDEVIVFSHGSQKGLKNALAKTLPVLLNARPVRKLVLWICQSSEDIYPGKGDGNYYFEQLAYMIRPRDCPCACNRANCVAYNADGAVDARHCPGKGDPATMIAAASYVDPVLTARDKDMERPSSLGITKPGQPFQFLSPDGRVLVSTVTTTEGEHPAQPKTGAGTTPEPTVTTSGQFSDAPAAGGPGVDIFGGTQVHASDELKTSRQSMNPTWRRRPAVGHRPKNFNEQYTGPSTPVVCKHPSQEGCLPRSALGEGGE